MAEKVEMRQRAARLRDDLARTGKVVLRAPILVRAAEYAIRFLLGAVLAGATVFGRFAPFGLCMVGASGSGLDGFSALLGAAFGYLAFQGLEGGLRYVAAAILIFSVSFAFFDIKLYQKTWFMPVLAALLSGATGFVYLSDVGWDFTTLIGFSTELLLTGAGVYFYRIAFSSWVRPREEAGLSTKQFTSLLILGGGVLMALSQITVLGDLISVGRILAALAVMLAASQGGVGVGAATGVAAGLCMDLAAGGPGFCTIAFGFSGLMTGIFGRQGRIACSFAYVLSNAVAVLWAHESGVFLPLLYEVFAASVLFLILPDKLTRRLGLALAHEKVREPSDRAMRYVKGKLEDTSGAFQALYDSLRASFRTTAPNDSDTSAIFDRAANKVCRRCALRDACWQRDYGNTCGALNDALPAMLDRGRGETGDFPLHFASRCLHFPAFVAAANEELTALLCRRQYQSRLKESRAAVCRQYGELAAVLEGAAAELAADLTPDLSRERLACQHLAALGLEGSVFVFYDERGRLRVEIEGPDLSPLREPGELEAMAALMSTALRPPVAIADQRMDRLVFAQAEPLMAVAGVAAQKKDGETVSGDSGAWFKTEAGLLYLLLCDGMGSGPDASRESKLAIRLLERFLKAGVEPEAALKTLNSALALRGEEEGGFTTVDLLEVDLFNGEAALYKFGAAPTYVKKGKNVGRVTGSALPAGLTTGDAVAPDVTRLALAHEDTVVLVSDGVTGNKEDVWLRELVAAFDGTSPKDLARAILESEQAADGSDDRTILVVKIESRC